MKYKIYGLATFFSIVFLLSSCKKFLNQVPETNLSVDSLFSSLENTKSYLAQVYANIPNPYENDGNNWYGEDGYYNVISDEANWFAQNGFASNNFNFNTLSASYIGFEFLWPEWYKCIRNATDFINRIDGANPNEVNKYLKTRFKAEARALRAIYYFWLIRLYGPVIIIPEPLSVNATNSELALQRTPFDSCVNYIVTQLDSAYGELQSIASVQDVTQPLDDEYGRITTGICKAYKEQTLMLAASPLFNGNPAYTSVSNLDGTKLFPQTYDKNKWKQAADAAKEFIVDFVPNTYDLFTEQDTSAFMTAYKSCRDVISTDWNKEWIFGRSYSSFVGTYLNHATPMLVGYGSSVTKGGGYLAVNQSMVDAYSMRNGLPITNSKSGYLPSGFSMFKSPFDIKERNTFNQWVNREPRFYVGVTYNNSYWLNQGVSEDEVVVNMEYSGNSGKGQSEHNYSSTGYLVRKNITKGDANRGWCYLRLAEIYLDYAEALNEYDPGNPDILKYVNLIRARAGIPQYGSGSDMITAPVGQSAVRDAIRHERQVELAFEEVRYFDQRRWLTAATDLNQPVYGMNVNGNGDDFYNKTLVKNVSFGQRCYLWAIPSSEIRKDSKLVQNPGW
ncbi:hypothetical protein A9P82_10210 [Arachidicoccus ginsenosidimutans]|uniref:RagB/SusD family nutrient uptake outer membrane protein n=1 Tax=Arachidicoccus sp. BS20 TaxID=1850526 RepID=UPI0007F11C4F|nr:RagB/SusD family nutrient uptake outer membrane protein [Arachidicoccus sp. BS20]ANI89627.1 hypothetical protein A9P82_10210 [Arachidicoccus sp. BS20]